MSDDSSGYRDRLDRRQFIRAAGVSGAAALAGCAGGNGNGGNGNGNGGNGNGNGGNGNGGNGNGGNGNGGNGNGTSDSTVYDQTLVYATNNGVPANLHLNPMATQNYDAVTGAHVFERFVAYNFRTGEFEMAGLEDWSVDEETFTLTIREDLNWDTGEPVTARDLMTQFRLDKKLERALWDFVESVEQGGDEKTVVLNLKQETNPLLLKHALGSQGDRIHAYHPVYKEYLEKEGSAVQQFEWEEDVAANGSFSFDSKDKQAWNLTRNEEYHDAENVNFTDLQLLNRSDNTALQQGLMGGELDGMYSMFAPPNIAKSMPNHVQEVNTPAKWGYGILFNHDHEHFGKRAVRKAIAHVVDREAVAGNAGPRTKKAPEVVTGIAVDDQEDWLGDDMSSFDTYGKAEKQTDEAASLLQDAGYSKDGGTWTDESGNAISGQYVTPAGWTDWTTATNTVVDQLNSFGFDLEITSSPMGDFFGNYVDTNFALGAFYWMPGGARSSFPFYPLRWEMECPDIDGGHQFPTGEKTIPAMDGSGEMTISPLEEIQQVATMTNNDDAVPIIRRVAWHHNQTLPFLGVAEKQEQTWVSGKNFETPSEDDDVLGVKWATQWLPRTGEMNAMGN